MLALLSKADALITNWRPGVAEELGLSAEVLSETNPGLVWCRVSGYGQDGPLAAAPAFDTVIQARSGLMFAQGGETSPAPVRAYLADKVVAMFAAQAIVAALVQRGRTGEGSVLDVSMLDALSYFNGPDLLSERTLLTDSSRPAVSEQLTVLGCVPTANGWVTLNPVRGKHLKGMAIAAGHPEWTDELKLIEDPATRTRRIYELMASVTPSASTEVWLQRFADHDVPAGPVMDIDAHLADEQVEHSGTYVIYEHPQLGWIRQARYPARWSGTPAPDPTPAPPLLEPAPAPAVR
jgi:crotonobetainyl-CoA:carnitine CoA-transferase CaiB-like acyl-CoA transferase